MNRWVLSHLRPFPLDLEYALGLSIFILVFPYHDFRSNNTEKPAVGGDLPLCLSRGSKVVVWSLDLTLQKICNLPKGNSGKYLKICRKNWRSMLKLYHFLH